MSYGIPYVEAVLADHPQGYWRMNDLNDCSGYGRTTTFGGAGGTYHLYYGQPLRSGYNAAAYGAYYPSSGLVSTALCSCYSALNLQNLPSSVFPSSFTIEMWFSSYSTTSVMFPYPSIYNNARLFEAGGTYTGGYSLIGVVSLVLYASGSNMYLQLGLQPGSFSFGGANPTWAYTCSVLFTPYAASWTHVVAVNDVANSKMVIYLNGVQVSTESSCPSIAMGSVMASSGFGSFGMGSFMYGVMNDPYWSGGGDSPLAGFFSELAVYSTALSPARISEHYYAGTFHFLYDGSVFQE